MSLDFTAWIGNTETVSDTLEPARSNALRAALGETEALATGDPLPPLHHWLYFWDVRAPKGLGVDGHPARGGFLPPVPLPRRMWAGGRLTFHAPLKLGDEVSRRSTIANVTQKEGRSGKLVFVTMQHEFSGPAGLAVAEEQDIVYREAAAPGSIKAPGEGATAPEAPWRREVMPDPVLLFRYSALTMNGHRIHYDRPYAMNEEAYPALVVQGPLQATLLADIAQHHLNAALTSFDFRGQSPAFDGAMLHVCGQSEENGKTKLWTEQGGSTCMVASAEAG